MKKYCAVILVILICFGVFCGCVNNGDSAVMKNYNKMSEYEKLVVELVQVVYFTEDVINSEESVNITDVYEIVMDESLTSFKDYLLERYPELAEDEDFEEEYRETKNEYVQDIEEKFFCSINDIEDIRIIEVDMLKGNADVFGINSISGDDVDTGFLVAIGTIDGKARVLEWEMGSSMPDSIDSSSGAVVEAQFMGEWITVPVE